MINRDVARTSFRVQKQGSGYDFHHRDWGLNPVKTSLRVTEAGIHRILRMNSQLLRRSIVTTFVRFAQQGSSNNLLQTRWIDVLQGLSSDLMLKDPVRTSFRDMVNRDPARTSVRRLESDTYWPVLLVSCQLDSNWEQFLDCLRSVWTRPTLLPVSAHSNYEDTVPRQSTHIYYNSIYFILWPKILSKFSCLTQRVSRLSESNGINIIKKESVVNIAVENDGNLGNTREG